MIRRRIAGIAASCALIGSAGLAVAAPANADAEYGGCGSIGSYYAAAQQAYNYGSGTYYFGSVQAKVIMPNQYVSIQAKAYLWKINGDGSRTLVDSTPWTSMASNGVMHTLGNFDHYVGGSLKPYVEVETGGGGTGRSVWFDSHGTAGTLTYSCS